MNLKLEMPTGAHEFAEISIAQAEKAFDTFIDAVNSSATRMPKPVAEVPRRRYRSPNRR